MSIIKKNELKQMGNDQLKEKLNELRRELLKINTQISTGANPESPGKVKEIKRTVARIHMLTYQNKKPKEVKQPKL